MTIGDRELDALREAELMMQPATDENDAYKLLRLTLSRFTPDTPEGAWLLKRALEIVNIDPGRPDTRRVLEADARRFAERHCP